MPRSPLSLFIVHADDDDAALYDQCRIQSSAHTTHVYGPCPRPVNGCPKWRPCPRVGTARGHGPWKWVGLLRSVYTELKRAVVSSRFKKKLQKLLSPVYTIQAVVKPVVNPVDKSVWQPVVSCIQTFNRLSNPFHNRFVNRLYRLSNRLYNAVWQPVERTVAVRSNRLYNRFNKRLYRVNGVLTETSTNSVLRQNSCYVSELQYYNFRRRAP